MTHSLQNNTDRHAYELRSQSSSKTSKLSTQQLFLKVKHAIIEATESQNLEYEDVDPQSGIVISRSLSETPEIERILPRVNFNSVTQVLRIKIMPTELHDCHQLWMKNEMRHMLTDGFLNEAELDYLDMRVGTRFEGFQPPYTFSSKEPDLAIRPDGVALPTVVVESGWSESLSRLREDMQLWLEGGTPLVQLVLLIKWSRLSGNRVKGSLEVYGRNSAGIPMLLQTESIFPVLTTPAVISISRSQLFGSTIFAGRNSTDTHQLSVTRLQAIALPWIQNLGCTPV
ncbi:hypothetical protein EMCG_03668 [[Emmonsia] crescens]|uniref:Restriction endonuclease domain-containing protein n=1 Tax=[Emmonsia] crescens TaxID=73230 RepID=A0A0G2HUX1_9EURO|nr:hypothetical protein EMCG_03668 [Emmonsia crescens UAMH 3008]